MLTDTGHWAKLNLNTYKIISKDYNWGEQIQEVRCHSDCMFSRWSVVWNLNMEVAVSPFWYLEF